MLRALLVASCYEDMRQLALALQDVIPIRPARVRHDETALGRVRRLAELELLLQMFKTIINDARLVLVGYVDMDSVNRRHRPGASAPDRAAQALVTALHNVAQDHKPSTAAAPDNPLRDTVSFNDERFLAAVWRAYRRYRKPVAVPRSAPAYAAR